MMLNPNQMQDYSFIPMTIRILLCNLCQQRVLIIRLIPLKYLEKIAIIIIN